MTDEQQKQIRAEFGRAVNMAPAELEVWLRTETSRSVGWTRQGEREAIGHQSGRQIVAIKRKKAAELNEDDYSHMQKVVGYVHRHTAQRPEGDIRSTRWRYSLMNWGHDPLKST
jgi:Protein of unknown function (DUF3140)